MQSRRECTSVRDISGNTKELARANLHCRILPGGWNRRLAVAPMTAAAGPALLLRDSCQERGLAMPPCADHFAECRFEDIETFVEGVAFDRQGRQQFEHLVARPAGLHDQSSREGGARDSPLKFLVAH